MSEMPEPVKHRNVSGVLYDIENAGDQFFFQKQILCSIKNSKYRNK